MAICVPAIGLVISKTVRKSKYTNPKTIIWTQSWICAEIQDLDLHIFEIILKIMDSDAQVIDVESQIMDFQNMQVKIPDFYTNPRLGPDYGFWNGIFTLTNSF